MVKFYAYLFPFLLVGCTAQEFYFVAADLHNVCIKPIHITPYNHTSDGEYINPDKALDPGDTRRVLNLLCPYDDLQLCVSSAYKLELSSDGRTRSLDKAQFLKILERAKDKHNGYLIHVWTIKDLTLCP